MNFNKSRIVIGENGTVLGNTVYLVPGSLVELIYEDEVLEISIVKFKGKEYSISSNDLIDTKGYLDMLRTSIIGKIDKLNLCSTLSL